jgi:hypothetical protein
MEYQVPQFIEVEDRIVGPLTLKQFIYVAGASGLCVIFFAYFNIIIALLLSALVIGFALSLAFYKVNGKPFIQVLEAGFNYYLKSKLFLWKHQDSGKGEESAAAEAAAETDALRDARNARKLTRGKLSDLALSLDVRTPPQSSGSIITGLSEQAPSEQNQKI